MTTILTGEVYWRGMPDQQAWVADYLHRHAARLGIVPMPTGVVGPPLEAFVNDGRVVVQCECHGAQVAWRHDLRFFCVDCLNLANGGQWRPVTWPVGV